MHSQPEKMEMKLGTNEISLDAVLEQLDSSGELEPDSSGEKRKFEP